MHRGWFQLFLIIFLPLFLLSGAVVFYSYYQVTERREILELRREQHGTELQNSIIAGELEGLSSDLLFLAELFNEYPTEAGQEELSQKLLSFAAHRNSYDQLRFLDYSGIEKVRINYNSGSPSITPAADLQNKGERYYFKETIALDKGQIFISPFDLNMEKGVIEQPIKPVVRIATPVFNKKGEKQGIFILNYLGNRLFSRMKQAHTHNDCQLMLLNHEGYWLFGPDETMNWGFMFRDRQQQTFGHHYPAIWEKLSNLEKGQLSLPAGTFTWRSLSPWQHSRSIIRQDIDNQQGPGSERTWKIVMLRETGVIAKELEPVKKTHLIIFALLTIALIMVSALIAYLRMKQTAEANNRKLLQEAQLFTNKLLKSALSTESLEQEMAESLEMILSISWVSILAKGAIFLLDEETNELIMVAEQGLAKPLLTACARLPIGRCLCGKAAERKKIIFTSCLDHQHEIRYEGITEHGHICVPIIKDEKVMGVLNLYVEHGHKYNPLYDDLLKTITNALASIVERKQMDDRLKQAHKKVQKNRDQLAFERSIVEDTLLRIRSAEEFDAEGIRYLLAPVENTAGDILLSARRPDGTRHIMLGDFTGHGLPSALAGPAVADAFYAMTNKGLSALKILSEINAKLVEKLPTHLYLAACFIEFDSATNRLSLWNAGLPDTVLFRSGLPFKRYQSRLLALGIIEDLSLAEGEMVVEFEPGDRLYTFTDGVLEASDANEVMFGQERFEALLSSIINGNKPLETVMEVLSCYQAGDEQADDITLLEILI